MPFSQMPGLVFPAVPPPRAAWAMALQFQLSQSQWWPRARVEAVQLQQARLLLDHARTHCAHYQHALRHLNGANELDWQTWRTIPFLTRELLRTQMDSLRSRAPPPEHGEIQVISTSGSTGSPVLVTRTSLNQLIWEAGSLRDHLWHRRDLSLGLAAIRYIPPAAGTTDESGLRIVEGPGWGPSIDSLAPTGAGVTLDIGTDIPRQWDFLVKMRPAYLLTYPSNLRALVEEARRRGERLPGLLQARTISEALPDDLRESVREVLGVRLVDTYSTKELGYVALQHPEQDHYLNQAETCLMEVLRDDGTPCAPGETGKVVLTDLHSFALPLIRYDVGDFAEVAPPSPCGRGLPAIRRILGRVRNMLVHPDGRRTWPLFPDRELRAAAPIRQYQVVQHAIDHIEARFVPERALTPQQIARLREVLNRSLGIDFRIDVVPVEHIPRTAAGKYEDFRSEIGS